VRAPEHPVENGADAQRTIAVAARPDERRTGIDVAVSPPVIAPVAPCFAAVAPGLAGVLARFPVMALAHVAIDLALVVPDLALVVPDLASALGAGPNGNDNGGRQRGIQKLTHQKSFPQSNGTPTFILRPGFMNS